MKYKNLIDKPLFGNYSDPYKDRRVKGSLRPSAPLPYVTPDFKRNFNNDSLYVSWLGHSSMFLHMSGLNILIDPIFTSYASPIPIPMLKRFEGKRVSASDFPNIDIVCITHNHYDHLDLTTLHKLNSQVKQFIVPKGVKKYLVGIHSSKILELQWKESIRIHDLEITALPTQHGSARLGLDSNTSLWCSYLLKNAKYTVYDTGDGGYSPTFSEIYKQYGPMDLVIAECGQYNERWHGFHMFPEESVQACIDLHAKLAIPVHHGAFILSNHAYNEPPIRFSRQAKELGLNHLLPDLYSIIEL